MIQEKTGVLLVNTGSPAAPTPQAVGAYLSEFLMDGAIRPPASAAMVAYLARVHIAP